MPQNKDALKLARKLESSGDKTLALFSKLNEEDWQIQIYFDGPGWNIHNLLAHFTEVEAAIPRLIVRILDGEEGVRKDFDIDRYNKKNVEEMSQYSNEELLLKFERRRNATFNLVSNLTSIELNTWGRHPFLGKSQVKDMLKLMFLHIGIHERDIRKALADSK